MEDCLKKNLDQCEVVCLDPSTPTADIGLTCSAASSKYAKAKPPDYDKAEQLLDRACTGGAWEVCVSIANRYFKGTHGATRDRDKARTYYMKACNNNYKPGCDGIEKLDEINAIMLGRDAGADGAAPATDAAAPPAVHDH